MAVVARAYLAANLKKFLVAGLLMMFLGVFFETLFKFLVVGTIFCALNILVRRYQVNNQLPIEIELVTIGTVISTIKFGIVYGLIFAIVSWYLGEIINENLYGGYVFLMLGGYVASAFLALLVPESSIVIGGIIITLVTNFIVFILGNYTGISTRTEGFFSSLTNAASNIFFFAKLAPLALLLVH